MKEKEKAIGKLESLLEKSRHEMWRILNLGSSNKNREKSTKTERTVINRQTQQIGDLLQEDSEPSMRQGFEEKLRTSILDTLIWKWTHWSSTSSSPADNRLWLDFR